MESHLHGAAACASMQIRLALLTGQASPSTRSEQVSTAQGCPMVTHVQHASVVALLLSIAHASHGPALRTQPDPPLSPGHSTDGKVPHPLPCLLQRVQACGYIRPRLRQAERIHSCQGSGGGRWVIHFIPSYRFH